MSTKKQTTPEERLLTRTEVAEIFQVAPSTVTRWAEAGKLPAVKTLGGQRRYAAKVVQDLVKMLIKKEALPTYDTPPRMKMKPRREDAQKRDAASPLLTKEISMKETIIPVPTMYGDHHVLEVRRILLDMPGVVEVKASSYFQTVQVSYDSTRLDVAQISAQLAQAGYLEPLPVAEESKQSDSPLVEPGQAGTLRHTVAYAQAQQGVGFAQEVHPSSRPLWPCPGFGVITQKELSDG